MRLNLLEWLALILVGCFYCLEVLLIPRDQFSDFLYYYNEAISYYHSGKLSELFIHLKSPLVVWFLGIICNLSIVKWKVYLIVSVLIISYLYLIFTKKEHYLFRWIGFVLITFSPSIISLLPYVNTDILFSVFFVIGHFLLFAINKENKYRSGWQWIMASIVFGIAQTIRSVMLYYFLFLIISWFIILFSQGISIKRKFVINSIIGIFSFFVVSQSIHLSFGYGYKIQPKSAGMISLYIGSNKQLRGGYSDSDASKALQFVNKEINTNVNIYHDSLVSLAVNRIRLNWFDNILSFPVKAFNLMNPYVTSVFLRLNYNTTFQIVVFWIILISSFLTIGAYFICFYALMMVLLTKRISEVPDYFFIILLSVYSYTFLHISLLEIQPRYYLHLAIIQFFLLPKSVTIIKDVINKK